MGSRAEVAAPVSQAPSVDAGDSVDVMPRERLRVTLELSRSDDPELFAALAALDKGRRRVARLRTLAHDGLVAGMARAAGAVGGPGMTGPGASDDAPRDVDTGDAANQVIPGPGEEQSVLAPLAPAVTGAIFELPSDG